MQAKNYPFEIIYHILILIYNIIHFIFIYNLKKKQIIFNNINLVGKHVHKD